MNSEDLEILQTYIAETRDLLDEGELGLLALQESISGPDAAEIINALFRVFHSIKGAAATLAFSETARLTHAAESLLSAFRKREAVPNSDLLVPLLQTVDLARQLTALNEAGQSEQQLQAQVIDLHQQLTSALEQATGRSPAAEHTSGSSPGAATPAFGQSAVAGGQADAPAEPSAATAQQAAATVGHGAPTVESAAATQQVPPAPSAGDVGAPSEGLNPSEFLDTFQQESQDLLAQIEGALLTIDAHPDGSSDALKSAFRAMHSLKGNCGFMGQASLQRLAHRAETLLEVLQSSPHEQVGSPVAALLKAVDALRVGVAEVARGGTPDEATIRYAEQALDDAPLRRPLDLAKLPAPGQGHDGTPAARTNAADPFAPVGSVAPVAKSAAHGGLAGLSLPVAGPSKAPVIAEMSPAAGPASSNVKANPMPLIGTPSLLGALAGAVSRGQPVPIVSAPAPAAVSMPAAAPTTAKAATHEERPAARGGAGLGTDGINAPSGAERQDVRVDLRRLDAMVNLASELVIAEAMVLDHPLVAQAEDETLARAVHMLRRVSIDLQDLAMALRMVPLSGAFRKLVRVVHDVTRRVGKQIKLELIGEETEVDKSVLELLSDPLVHLVRNAIDHGIEAPDARRAAGKPEEGTITVEARHSGSEVLIVVRDDGRGLDRQRILRKATERSLINGNGETMSDQQVFQLIFEPGFSTAAEVTDISGRGVGMDVVRNNIAKLKGTVELRSELGVSTAVIMHIPLTVAIIDGMLVRVGRARYTLPLLTIREALRPEPSQITITPDGREIVRIREELLPVVRLHDIFGREPDHRNLHEGILIVTEAQGQTTCLFADEIVGQQQTVIKALSSYLGRARGVSGCTILGDGEVSLILDVGALVSLAQHSSGGLGSSSTELFS